MLIPINEDLQANLKYARQQTKDQLDTGETTLVRQTFFWIYSFNLDELVISFLILNIVLFSVAILRKFKRKDLIDWTFNISLILYLLISVSVFFRYGIEKHSNQGVVLAKEVNIKSGIGQDSVSLFKLHEGAEVIIGEEKEGWLKIILNDGKKGWVEKRFVMKVTS